MNLPGIKYDIVPVFPTFREKSIKKVGLLYVACTRSNSDPYQNISYGIVAVIAVLIGPLSLILFPNCTFIRPHPACWRMVFGASLVYFLSLVFMLFLNMEQVRFV